MARSPRSYAPSTEALNSWAEAPSTSWRERPFCLRMARSRSPTRRAYPPAIPSSITTRPLCSFSTVILATLRGNHRACRPPDCVYVNLTSAPKKPLRGLLRGADKARPEGAEQGTSGHRRRLGAQDGGPQRHPGQGGCRLLRGPAPLGPDQDDRPLEGRGLAARLGQGRPRPGGHVGERRQIVDPRKPGAPALHGRLAGDAAPALDVLGGPPGLPTP